MIFLLPLAIVWIIITVLLVFLSFGKEYDRIPFVPEPVEYIVALAMSLFVPPLSAVAFLIEHPSIILIAFEGLFDILFLGGHHSYDNLGDHWVFEDRNILLCGRPVCSAVL